MTLAELQFRTLNDLRSKNSNYLLLVIVPFLLILAKYLEPQWMECASWLAYIVGFIGALFIYASVAFFRNMLAIFISGCKNTDNSIGLKIFGAAILLVCFGCYIGIFHSPLVYSAHHLANSINLLFN